MTAGNSTPLTDGASAVLLGSEEWAADHGLKPLAWFVDGETASVDYVSGDEGLLMAPAYAVPRMLDRQGLTLQDFDLYEIHEAFASTVLSTMAAWESETFCRERLGRDGALGAIDRAKLNVTGSSLAAGHPFAATGGRIVATLAKLLHEQRPRLARARLHLRRRRPGRRRDPRGGLRWRTATATPPSSPPPPVVGSPRRSGCRSRWPCAATSRPGPSSTAPLLVGGHGDTPALAALRDGLTAAGATLVPRCPRTPRARRCRRRPHRRGDARRPRVPACHPRPGAQAPRPLRPGRRHRPRPRPGDIAGPAGRPPGPRGDHPLGGQGAARPVPPPTSSSSPTAPRARRSAP